MTRLRFSDREKRAWREVWKAERNEERKRERKREKESERKGHVCWPKQGVQNNRDIRIHLSYARARANYRRFSVPFVANPIIRNETASFHSLVQTHLFILRGRAWARTRE